MSTDDELAQARAEGERAALGRVGRALVEAEFRAALRGRHHAPEAVVEYLDHTRFVTADGHVDRTHVEAYADAVCRAPAAAFPDLGQGRREYAPAPHTMNDAIREAAGYGRRTSGPRY